MPSTTLVFCLLVLFTVAGTMFWEVAYALTDLLMLSNNFDTLQASQCLLVVRQKRGCEFYSRSPSMNITWCMEDCLVDGSCNHIQWNHVTKACYKGSRRIEYREPKSEGDCITLRKYDCFSLEDTTCLKEDSGLEILGTDVQIKGLQIQQECNAICRFNPSCAAFIWNQGKHSCILKEIGYAKRSNRTLQPGDKQVLKDRPCTTGNRCMYLKISARLNGATEDKSVNTFSDCFRKMQSRNDVYMIDWNYDHNGCWLHRGHNTNSHNYPNEHIIEIIKNIVSKCKIGKKVKCISETKNAFMDGGYSFVVPERKDCLHICNHTVNCAAVDWDDYGRRCIFHHVQRPLKKNQPGYSHYSFTDCPATTSTNSPSTEAYNHEVTQCHFVRNLKSIYSPTLKDRTTKLTCAKRCCIKSCHGFSCFPPTNDVMCIINDVTQPMYIPGHRSMKPLQ